MKACFVFTAPGIMEVCSKRSLRICMGPDKIIVDV